MTEDAGNRPLKYTVTHYRLPQHTHEEFMKWLVEVHLPLGLPVLKRHGILGFALFATPEALNGPLKEQMSKVRPGWDFADYDCFIEYMIPDMETIQKVMADPDWATAIKDQEEWVDISRALVSLGYHTQYLRETGEIVNLPK